MPAESINKPLSVEAYRQLARQGIRDKALALPSMPSAWRRFRLRLAYSRFGQCLGEAAARVGAWIAGPREGHLYCVAYNDGEVLSDDDPTGEERGARAEVVAWAEYLAGLSPEHGEAFRAIRRKTLGVAG